jgi:hypothetical protein
MPIAHHSENGARSRAADGGRVAGVNRMSISYSPIICGQCPTPGCPDIMLFGQDLAYPGTIPNTHHPISDAVKRLFVSLTRRRGTNSFESFTAVPEPDYNPSVGNLTFGNGVIGTMNVQGLATIRADATRALSGTTVMEALAGSSGHDPYAFTLTFTPAVAGWGFYGIGFGTAGERNVYVEYGRADGTSCSVIIPHYQNGAPGEYPLAGRSVLFFGLVAAGSPIASVTLAQAKLSGDRLFLDNMLVARRRAYHLSPSLALAAIT